MRYQKPIIIANDELAEGVYAASGSRTCYTATAYIHQKPEIGRGDYRIQVNAVHNATDGHTNDLQTLHITFNQEVTYSSSNGKLISSEKGNYLQIEFSYHQNAFDNIGLGDLVVTSEPGLSIINVYITD